MLPERAFCGHWLHSRCFDEYINLPPFKRECPFEDCSKILASTNYEVDATSVKQREKKWLQQASRDGEVDEMNRLFGM